MTVELEANGDVETLDFCDTNEVFKYIKRNQMEYLKTENGFDFYQNDDSVLKFRF